MSKQTYELQTLKLADLTPHPKNPRVHPDGMIKKLCRSIEEFGFTNPVLVSEDKMILAGHARCKAAEKLGLETVPCIVLPLAGLSADAYVIADNKLNELSEWDEEKLAELFNGFDLGDFDAELTGFSTDEIDAMFTPKGCVEDDFDEEKEKQKVEERGGAVTQMGDIWLLGQHRLICGDSTEADTFEKLMDGKRAQVAVTSPPYGIAGSKPGGMQVYESGDIDEWRNTMSAAIKNMAKHADVVCYNIADKFNTGGQFIICTFAESVQMFADNGMRPLYVRIWNKQRKALSSTAPVHLSSLKPVGEAEYVAAFAGTEPMVVGDGEADMTEFDYISAFANHNYKLVKRLSKQERREWGWSSIWNIPSVAGSAKTKGRLDERTHKARYPVTLCWRLAKMHGDRGNILLDPFSGTATSIIAAEQLGMCGYGIERDGLYCDISVARFHDFAPDAEIFLLRNGETIPLAETGLLDEGEVAE